jgi:dolichol-phosphate mannosyltransferase
VYGKKKNNIEITIIIPIHNEEQIIPELYNRLQNTVSQISKNYELIFVNDGSKDHSLLELIKLSEQDLRVFTSFQ